MISATIEQQCHSCRQQLWIDCERARRLRTRRHCTGRSRNKTTSTLIMVYCLSMMDALHCLLAMMVMVIYNCHQIEINNHTHATRVCKTQQKGWFFLFWYVSRGGWSRWRATVVVVLCTLFCVVTKKDKRRWWRMRTNATQRARSAVRDCVVFLVSA